MEKELTEENIIEKMHTFNDRHNHKIPSYCFSIDIDEISDNKWYIDPEDFARYYINYLRSGSNYIDYISIVNSHPENIDDVPLLSFMEYLDATNVNIKFSKYLIHIRTTGFNTSWADLEYYVKTLVQCLIKEHRNE